MVDLDFHSLSLESLDFHSRVDLDFHSRVDLDFHSLESLDFHSWSLACVVSLAGALSLNMVTLNG